MMSMMTRSQENWILFLATMVDLSFPICKIVAVMGKILSGNFLLGKFCEAVFFVLLIGIVKALVPQSCPILCDPMDCSLPGSSVRGILQARTLEWVARPSSGGIFPTQESKPTSHALAGGFFTPEPPGKLTSLHQMKQLDGINLHGQQEILSICTVANLY